MRSLLAVCACLGLVALAVAEPPGRLAKGPPGRMTTPSELMTYAPQVDVQEADEQPPIDGRLVMLAGAGMLTMPAAQEDAKPADVELCCHKKSRSRSNDPAPDDGNGGGAYGGNFQRYIPTCEPPDQPTAQRNQAGAAASACQCTCGNCCCKQKSAGTATAASRAVYSYPVASAAGFYGGSCSDGSCANGSCSNGSCSSSSSRRSRRGR